MLNQPKSSQNQNQLEDATQTKVVYQIQQDLTISQADSSYSMDFTKDCKILVVAEDFRIKIFSFNLKKLKLINKLFGHRLEISILKFMLNSSHLVSTCLGGSISIWSKNLLAKPVKIQQLSNHLKGIICCTINSDENLLITGSYDTTINVWSKKESQWLCSQKLTHHTSCVNAISLNQNQNTLISCGHDSQIIIYGRNVIGELQGFIKIQSINVEKNGFRLCFVDNNLFTFQPIHNDDLQIYQRNHKDEQFIKSKEILVKGGLYCYEFFPQYFITEKQLLINKHGYHVNILRKKSNQEFEVEQSINFNHYFVFGSISYNGDYLATWDWISKEIQIRKYQES